MSEKLSTGIDTIDRRLSGGLEPGCILAVVANPAMQSEQLLQELIAQRQTLYLTTLRKPEAVKDGFDGQSTADLWVEYVGADRPKNNEFLKRMTGTGSYTSHLEDSGITLDATLGAFGNVTRQANVVIDPVNPLEEANDKTLYREVLNTLKSTMSATGGIGVLHCIQLDNSTPFRDITLAIADIVWKLELVSLKNTMEYQLTIPKNRYGTPVLEETSLVFDSGVWVDDSRNI